MTSPPMARKTGYIRLAAEPPIAPTSETTTMSTEKSPRCSGRSKSRRPSRGHEKPFSCPPVYFVWIITKDIYRVVSE